MAKGLVEEQNLKNIANAIREKNGETTEYTPAQMSEKIQELEIGIDTTDADAVETDIIEHKTAYINNEKITGVLKVAAEILKNTDSSQVTITLGTEKEDPSISFKTQAVNDKEVISENYDIQVVARQAQLATSIGLTADKLKKDEVVLGVKGTLDEGTDTSDGNVSASNIEKDKVAYSKGNKITGALPIIKATEAKEYTTAKVEQADNDYIELAAVNMEKTIIDSPVTIKVQVEANKVAEKAGLTASKIKKGETILGVTGTYEGEGSQQGMKKELNFTLQDDLNGDIPNTGDPVATIKIDGNVDNYIYTLLGNNADEGRNTFKIKKDYDEEYYRIYLTSEYNPDTVYIEVLVMDKNETKYGIEALSLDFPA